MFSSIKARLIGIFLLILLFVYAFLGVYLYYNLKYTAIAAADEHLHSEVELLAGLIRADEEGYELGEMTEAAVGEYSEPLSGHYFQVTDGSGKILVSSPSLYIVGARLPFGHSGHEPLFSTTVGPDRKPHRMLERAFVVGGKTYVVQASDTLDDEYALLASFRKNLVILFVVVFLVSAVVVFFVASAALKSLGVFTRKVGTITEKSLGERVNAEGVPSELKPLSESFNLMLDRLERSFEGQKEFLSDASHELRTPTSVIRSQCDVILSKDRSDEEYKEALRSISQSASRISHLIEKILEASRLSSGMYSFEAKDVPVMEVLRDVASIMRISADRRGIGITLGGDECVVVGDRERLAEAFNNIIFNAVKYSHNGGSVKVNVSGEANMCRVTITDAGIGIREEDLLRVFERFYRSAEARAKAEGTGLGLPITKSIVESHGGKISAGGRYGEGAVFTVELPLKS